jgi:hypothetical protein
MEGKGSSKVRVYEYFEPQQWRNNEKNDDLGVIFAGDCSSLKRQGRRSLGSGVARCAWSKALIRRKENDYGTMVILAAVPREFDSGDKRYSTASLGCRGQDILQKGLSLLNPFISFTIIYSMRSRKKF